MKTLLFSLFSLAYLSGFSEKLGADYQITKSGPDKTLNKSEAAFAFTLYDPNGKFVKTEVMFSYNKINRKQKPDANGKILLKVKPGKYIFQFFLNSTCKEIYTDSILIKPSYLTEVNINFSSVNELIIVDKPVIYVYPKAKQKISIQLNLKGEFTFTYPEYKNGWDFVAEPDGTIEMNTKKYHYLFWDGKLNIETAKVNWNEGFIVEKKNQVKFFEEKLQLMGLNSQEIEDYITYWCPRMAANENNYIHFMFNRDYDEYAKLTVNPKPNNLFRVCMIWSKVEAKDNNQLSEQKIETFKRDGFTVVEWGGAEFKKQINLIN